MTSVIAINPRKKHINVEIFKAIETQYLQPLMKIKWENFRVHWDKMIKTRLFLVSKSSKYIVREFEKIGRKNAKIFHSHRHHLIYTLCFANDHVLIAQDYDDMTQKH